MFGEAPNATCEDARLFSVSSYEQIDQSIPYVESPERQTVFGAFVFPECFGLEYLITYCSIDSCVTSVCVSRNICLRRFREVL